METNRWLFIYISINNRPDLLVIAYYCPPANCYSKHIVRGGCIYPVERCARSWDLCRVVRGSQLRMLQASQDVKTSLGHLAPGLGTSLLRSVSSFPHLYSGEDCALGRIRRK